MVITVMLWLGKSFISIWVCGFAVVSHYSEAVSGLLGRQTETKYLNVLLLSNSFQF